MNKMDFIYHEGHLAVDRNLRDDQLVQTDEAAALDEKAERMMRASVAGKVVLYQKRRRSGYGFEYHARAIKGA